MLHKTLSQHAIDLANILRLEKPECKVAIDQLSEIASKHAHDLTLHPSFVRAMHAHGRGIWSAAKLQSVAIGHCGNIDEYIQKKNKGVQLCIVR